MRECFVLYCIVAKMFHVKHFDDDAEKMLSQLLVKKFFMGSDSVSQKTRHIFILSECFT